MFPGGQPIGLRLGSLALLAIFFSISWVHGWWRAIPISVLAAGFLGYVRLIRYYEHQGRAVRIRYCKTTTEFPSGAPAPIVLLRCAFFVGAALMLVFEFAPLSQTVARPGIIGCVLSLVLIAIAYIATESYYVKIGRGVEVDVKPPKENGGPQPAAR